MKLLKSIVTSSLISSFLLQGCYSFSEINKEALSEEDNFVKKEIRIHLKNGEVIQSKAYKHNFILLPPDSAEIKCNGYYLNSEKKFDGLIKKDEISLIEVYKYSSSDSLPIYVFGGFIFLIIMFYYWISTSISLG